MNFIPKLTDPETEFIDGKLYPVPPAEAFDFIEALTGDPDGAVTFQTFDDAENGKGKLPALSRVLHGTLMKCAADLWRLSTQGAGIFVMVNTGDRKGRSASNVQALRALFIDYDAEKLILPELPDFPLDPSFRVKTGRGSHFYFKLREGEPLQAFEAAQKTLAEYFGTDSMSDLPRVLRVPGFPHRKAEPRPVEFLPMSGREFSIAEVVAAHAKSTPSGGKTFKTYAGAGVNNSMLVWATSHADGILVRVPEISREEFIALAQAHSATLTEDRQPLAESDRAISGLWDRFAAGKLDVKPRAKGDSEPLKPPSWLSPAQVLRESASNAEKFPTGFPSLDEFTRGGIRAGDLVVIKGPTEAGKTSLATQIAQTWAKREDVFIVGIFDDEGRKAAAVRIGQGTFGLDRDRLEAGEENTVAEMDSLGDRIMLPDPDAQTFEEIAEEAVARANGRKVCIVVDSVQTVRSSVEAESERLAIKNLINAIRRYNAKHGIRTLALSEVNRGAYAARAEKDRVSKLSSGSGSSRIEYGCELLLDIEGACLIEVLKNRIGGTKRGFAVEFDPESATFSEIPADVAARRAEEAQKAEETIKLQKTVSKIREALRGGKRLSLRTLRDVVGGNRTTFAKALHRAEEEGRIASAPRSGKGGGEEYFIADDWQ